MGRPIKPDPEANARCVMPLGWECSRRIAGIWRQPSSRRRRICPLMTRPKSKTSAVSSVGSAPCVFTRRRNSSFSRSITLVVRNVFHCARGKPQLTNLFYRVWEQRTGERVFGWEWWVMEEAPRRTTTLPDSTASRCWTLLRRWVTRVGPACR